MSNDSNITLNKTIFTGNSAPSKSGGAVYLSGGQQYYRCKLFLNTSDWGALYLNDSNLTLSNSILQK